jgi:hypothetical protein
MVKNDKSDASAPVFTARFYALLVGLSILAMGWNVNAAIGPRIADEWAIRCHLLRLASGQMRGSMQYFAKQPKGDPMVGMFGDIAIGLVSLGVGVLLVFIGMPKHGEPPRFLRFEASIVLYPAVIMAFLAFGGALVMRAYIVG